MALAEDFVAMTGTTSFRMLWDPGFNSWALLGVASQPAWALFTPAGELVELDYGSIDTRSVLETAATL